MDQGNAEGGVSLLFFLRQVWRGRLDEDDFWPGQAGGGGRTTGGSAVRIALYPCRRVSDDYDG